MFHYLLFLSVKSRDFKIVDLWYKTFIERTSPLQLIDLE